MSARLDVSVLQSPAPTGALERVDGDGVIEGWCWAPAIGGRPATVEIRLDGVAVATALCSGARADLAKRGIGDGAHGFLMVLAPELCRPGTNVEVSLHEQASGRLVGGPLRVVWRGGTVAPAAAWEPPVLEGNLDDVTPDGLVSGWCWYPMQPDAHVTLSVLIDEAIVGSVCATRFRPDLEQVGIGDGTHGFSFPLPWQALDGRGRLSVAVADAATGLRLGPAKVLRLGPLSAAEDRMAALEQQIRHLRAEIVHLSGELDRRDAEGPTQDMFASIGALFTELGGGTQAGDALSGFSLRHTIERLRTRHAPLTVAIAADPVAVIAIPAEATFAALHGCLAALHTAGIDRQAEIVLLDFGTGPAELSLLPSLVRNLRVVSQDGPCTLSLPVGPYETRPIAWLSPWLRPDPGWLDGLLATLAREPEAALVCGRVLGADGLLRDAGLLADADEILQPLGALDDASRPEFSFMREVDAVSALGFVVRAQAWRDHAPRPGVAAGLAALDLCRRLRAAGHRILMQPHATALCHDGADLSALVGEPIGDGATHRFAGHALVIDSALPRPDHDAGSMATCEQLQILRRLGYRVTFAATAGISADDPAALHLESLGIELVRPPAAGSVTAWLLQHGAGLDVVQVWRHMNASQFLDRVRAMAPRARMIFSPADLHHVREARRAALAAGSAAGAAAVRVEEFACVHAFDATIVHSDAEYDLLRAEVSTDRLRLMRWIAHPAPAPCDFAERSGMCFVGSFAHGPNEDGLRWLIAEILPILRSTRPGLTLHVVGAGLSADLAAITEPDIVIHGWVEDLAGLFAGMRLSVAPLRYGAGFKGKVATSLSFGVPVIATTIAIEGTGLHDGDGVDIADAAEQFAEQIIRLHDSETRWRAQSTRAIERCKALYAPDAALEVYRSLFSALDLPRAVA